MTHPPRRVRRVLCHANRDSEICARAADSLVRELGAAGYDVTEDPAAFSDGRPELLVILGGDGFLMESLRLLDYPETPVFGANFGSVGFLMNTKNSLGELLKMLEGWDFDEETHPVLRAKVVLEEGAPIDMLAFNDFVVERMTRQSLRLEILLDDVLFNHYAGDGFIFSTSAGSTAYNLAAGGPVVHPSLQVITVTPLYPHRASPFHSMQFSLVVPLKCILRVDAKDLPKRGMRIVGDGRSVDRSASVEIRDSGRRVTILRPRSHRFVKTLARKFIGE